MSMDDLTALIQRPTWMQRAACRGMNPALFFLDRGESGVAHAKATCAACPVADECHRYAVVNGEEYGIWGGRNAKDRRRARAAMKPPRPERGDDPWCGTVRGRSRHQQRRETVCAACAAAHAAYMGERRGGAA